MSASNATDPLRTFSRLIALGGNVQNPPTSTNGLGEAIRASNGMALCQKLITRLTLEARTDPQGLSSVANGIGAHCSDSDRVIGINYLGQPRRLNGDLVPQVPMNTTLAQVAGPDAMDGIKDLTVGMGTVVNATATGEGKERFAILSLGYAGKELKLDGLAAGNSSASRANATAVSVKSNGVWRQSESSAAGCALTAIEGVYPSFISGVRLVFACTATTQGGARESRPFVIAASSTGSTNAEASSGLGITEYTFIAAGVAVLLVISIVVGVGRLCSRRRNTKMFDPR